MKQLYFLESQETLHFKQKERTLHFISRKRKRALEIYYLKRSNININSKREGDFTIVCSYVFPCFCPISILRQQCLNKIHCTKKTITGASSKIIKFSGYIEIPQDGNSEKVNRNKATNVKMIPQK